jgi:hypothetical protein
MAGKKFVTAKNGEGIFVNKPFKTAQRLNASLEDPSRQVSLTDLTQQLERLLQSQLLMRSPTAEDAAAAPVPTLTAVSAAELFAMPKLDVKVWKKWKFDDFSTAKLNGYGLVADIVPQSSYPVNI